MDKKKFYEAKKAFDDFKYKRLSYITREFDNEGSTVSLSYFNNIDIHIEILCNSILSDSSLIYKRNAKIDVAEVAWFSPVYYLAKYKNIAFEQH